MCKMCTQVINKCKNCDMSRKIFWAEKLYIKKCLILRGRDLENLATNRGGHSLGWFQNPRSIGGGGCSTSTFVPLLQVMQGDFWFFYNVSNWERCTYLKRSFKTSSKLQNIKLLINLRYYIPHLPINHLVIGRIVFRFELKTFIRDAVEGLL